MELVIGLFSFRKWTTPMTDCVDLIMNPDSIYICHSGARQQHADLYFLNFNPERCSVFIF